MSGFLGGLFADQTGPMDIEIWMEPFAGGAGAGLALLAAGRVPEVWLVDQNPALSAMWRAMCDQGEELAARVAATVPNLAVWHEAKAVLQASEAGEQLEDLDLGLAAFLVNRCSRSGIVNSRVGPIGGKHQDGRWTVASRFNAAELAERIRRVHRFAQQGQLRFGEGDAIAHIADLNDSGIGDELLLFVDPPYLREGNRLYANGMTAADHQALADTLNTCQTPWLLTYDNEPLVPDRLYPDCRVLAYEIPNTANQQRVAWEYAVLSDNLRIDNDPQLLRRGDAVWLRSEADLRAQTWPRRAA